MAAIDRAKVEQSARCLIRGLGYDDRGELNETPRRIADAYDELTAGERIDPGDFLAVTFEADTDEMIVLRRVPFVSLCEHHLMPFTGHASVGYIPEPGAGVVGVSKLARVVDAYARRLQIQERLTAQIADCLQHGLKTAGVAVTIAAVHSCMTLRGVLKPGASLVTSDTRGVFREEGATRGEWWALTGGDF
jgi:GTP cyclohydrolase I